MGLRRVAIVLLLALVALLPTWRFVLGGQVPAPVAWAHQSAPWNDAEPASAYDILAMDGALQFLPWRDYMLKAYRAGHVPLWNHAALGGSPFLANSQSAVLYPLHWLWPFDAESLVGFSAWLHLLIAGLGVYALCRRLGSTTAGGLVGAISFQMSGFLIAWTALPSVVMTAAWIPWCLWATLWAAQAASPRSMAALGGSVGMMLLAGHLQIAAYGLLAVALMIVWLIAFPPAPGKRMRALWPLAGLALGLAISSAQTLPSIENGRKGHRAGVATAEGWQAYRGSAASPLELVTLVSPDFFGMPQPRNPQTGATGYWLAYQKPGRHYAEIAFYVAPLALPLAALALVGVRRRPLVGFFGVLALLGLAIAMGTPLAQALYFGVPGWSATGSPARAAVLVALGLCVLAGTALRQVEPRLGLVIPFTVAAVGVAAFFLASQFVPADVAQVFASGSVIWPCLLALAAAVVAWHSRSPSRATKALLALGAVIAFVPQADVIPSAPRGEYDREFAGMDALQNARRVAVVGEDWPFLAAPSKTIAMPNTLLPYGIKALGGYDSIISAAFKAKLDDANGNDSAPPANGNVMLVLPTADLAKLRAMGADSLMASSAFSYDLPLRFDGGDWRLYTLPGPDPQPFLFHEIYNHKRLRWEGDLREASRAWLASPDADGWEMSSATFDFDSKTVLAIYRPHSYRIGLLLAMLGTACAIALSFVRGAPRAEDEEH